MSYIEMCLLVVLPACALVTGIFIYGHACASRRIYACPRCGERFRTEFLKATRCNTCGAAVEEDPFEP